MLQPPVSEPAVSLVICTRNRAGQLQRCLAAVERIRCRQPWETVIVDKGSNDDTRAIAQAFLHDGAIGGCCVWEPRPGLSRARNAGLEASRGTIVAFTDDDCYPAADFLERVCGVFADPRIGF